MPRNVSLPFKVDSHLEAFVKLSRRSRSSVVTEAIEEYLAKRGGAEIAQRVADAKTTPAFSLTALAAPADGGGV